MTIEWDAYTNINFREIWKMQLIVQLFYYYYFWGVKKDERRGDKNKDKNS